MAKVNITLFMVMKRNSILELTKFTRSQTPSTHYKFDTKRIKKEKEKEKR